MNDQQEQQLREQLEQGDRITRQQVERLASQCRHYYDELIEAGFDDATATDLVKIWAQTSVGYAGLGQGLQLIATAIASITENTGPSDSPLRVIR